MKNMFADRTPNIYKNFTFLNSFEEEVSNDRTDFTSCSEEEVRKCEFLGFKILAIDALVYTKLKILHIRSFNPPAKFLALW